MSKETQKTLIFAAAATVAVLLAVAVRYSGSAGGPGTEKQLNEPFYPAFRNALDVKSLEVIVFAKGAGRASEFKVEWDAETDFYVLPRHHGYPADAEDRLAKTATSLLGIERKYWQAESKSEHEKYGVLDPGKATSYSEGLGRRVTVRDAKGTMLADFIIGKKVEIKNSTDATERYYVRTPDDDDVYIAECSIELSAKFADWIEADLLKVQGDDINHLTVDNYSVNEQLGALENRETNVLTREDFSKDWDSPT